MIFVCDYRFTVDLAGKSVELLRLEHGCTKNRRSHESGPAGWGAESGVTCWVGRV